MSSSEKLMNFMVYRHFIARHLITRHLITIGLGFRVRDETLDRVRARVRVRVRNG